MKKYIMLMAAVMLLLTAQGQKLTPRQIEDNAREWGLKMGKKAPVMMQRVELEGVESLAVYNYKDGGFVIVSGDGRARPVLGYSHRGSIDAGALPANVKYWLQEYQRQMDSLDMVDSEYLTPRKWNRAGAKDGYPDSVAPLLETEWTRQGMDITVWCRMTAHTHWTVIWHGLRITRRWDVWRWPWVK